MNKKLCGKRADRFGKKTKIKFRNEIIILKDEISLDEWWIRIEKKISRIRIEQQLWILGWSKESTFGIIWDEDRGNINTF